MTSCRRKVAILTVSDSCSAGQKEDLSGPNLKRVVESLLGWEVAETGCVADELKEIRLKLQSWVNGGELALILTTGGTGMSLRDVTPEATLKVLDRRADGLVHLMTSRSLQVTPLASLSRLVAGTAGRTLVVNLPGSKKGSQECLQFIAEVLPHAVDLLQDEGKSVEQTHKELQGQGVAHHHHHVCPHKNPQSKVDSGHVAGRARESPYPMISVSEAQSTVLSHCSTLGTETVSFTEALGRVLAEDIYAKEPLPPFPASVKDGYAVVTSDGAGVRPVSGGSNAGSSPDMTLTPGQCVRINTGGPIPAGADAVVQVEDTLLHKATEDGRDELEIKILKAPVLGQDIRPVGNDIKVGEHVLRKSSVLGPAEIGLLATVGAIQVEVFKRPTVSLLSTGNELQDPTSPNLAPGAIRDSNKSTLLALLKEEGIPTADIGIAVDEPKALLTKLREGLSRGDLLVTTGGVSMGDRDLLRQVLAQDLGATIHFARVKMKPGKPTTFATLEFEGHKKLVLGLPGNPVSATVTSHLYVLPACRKLSGHLQPLPAIVRAKLDQDVRLDARPEYRRVVLSWVRGQAVAESLRTGGCQMSSRLMSCASSNALLLLPARDDARAEMKQGEEVDAMIIGPLRSQ